MAGFNGNNQQLSPRQLAESNFKSARFDILAVALLTIINMVILLTGSDSYFLFSACVPFYLTMYAMLFTGRFPPEFYTGEFAGMEFAGDGYFYVTLGFAIVFVALYVVCFAMLRKPNKVWFIIALVAFVIDTLAIFFFVGFEVSILLDLAIHALVIFYLIKGIKACADLERLPVEAAQVAVEPTPAEEPFSEVENTQAVGSAPENVTETVNEVNGETSVSENGNNDNNG